MLTVLGALCKKSRAGEESFLEVHPKITSASCCTTQQIRAIGYKEESGSVLAHSSCIPWRTKQHLHSFKMPADTGFKGNQ